VAHGSGFEVPTVLQLKGFVMKVRRPLMASAALVMTYAAVAHAQATVPPARSQSMPQASAGTDTTASRAQEAGVALAQGNAQQAIALYGEALKETGLTNERRSTLHNDRGVAYWRANQHKAAIEEFNRAVTLLPEGSAAYNNRGIVLLALNLVTEAIKDFDRAVVLTPGYTSAYHNRATAQFQMGNYEAAGQDFTRAIELSPLSSPQSVPPLIGRGRARLAQSRPFAAVRDLTRAISLDGKDAAGYRHRAQAHLDNDNTYEAIEDYNRAIAADANNAELYLVRGRAYLSAKNTQSALKDLSKAIEIDAKSAAALAFRGLTKAKLSQHDEALADFSKAVENDPRFVPAYVHRAWTYRQMDQPETGLRDIERALKLEPKHAESYKVRAELHEALGRKDEAIADYKQALALDVKQRESAEALERLAGEASIEAQELIGRGNNGWRIFRRTDGSYLASSAAHPRLLITLEMAGPGEPRILGWEEQAAAFKGIGVLRYEAGTAENRAATNQAVELAAIIDLSAVRVVSVEPDKIGEIQSKWTWEDGKLTIAGIDGLTNEFRLRDQQKSKPAPAAVSASSSSSDDDDDDRRKRRRAAASNEGPSWAPWNEGRSQRSERSAQQDRPPQKKPKTLFDLLFN
jgi:tetratricopeptide (TPR) repeat protein